jgi:divalent metal cation (Fe/Co/Zn/Cd) transporter
VNSTAASDLAIDSRALWLRRAGMLAWFTIFYNLVEGIVSIWFGISDESLALFGFGADSFIETASGVIVLWRLRDDMAQRQHVPSARERRATVVIGALLALLGIATIGASVWQLIQRAHPQTTMPGMIIAAVSLAWMWWLWRWKSRTARALDSATIAADAACSLGCIKLSVVLFAGSVLYVIVPGLWWLDSAAAIVIAAMLLREGISTARAALRPDFHGGCCDLGAPSTSSGL